ncbi:GIY-YIG nuclease family protein [Patescibacteria group bacterium]|nr:GIY-YIG nuclease family protein [Patescibacteria group bacterium]
MKTYYVYITQSNNGRALYIGVTNNLSRRVYEHRCGVIDGFSKKYKCHKLVYFEKTLSIESAILREKQLKGWSRSKKNQPIEGENPEYADLSTLLEVTI